MAWFDDRPPGCVAGVAGLLPSEQACVDRGVEAVGADQGIPAFLRAVDEEGRNVIFVLLETRARRAQAHVLLAKLPQQEALEVGLWTAALGAPSLFSSSSAGTSVSVSPRQERIRAAEAGVPSRRTFSERPNSSSALTAFAARSNPAPTSRSSPARSKTVVSTPALRSAIAAVRPLMPAPTIIAFIPLALVFSCVCLRSVGRCRRALREMGSTTLTSIVGLWRRFSTVPGERMSAKMSRSAFQTAVVPLGERLGVPSGQTVAA